MLDLKQNRITVVNAERHAKGFLPASTFKIPSALIALETGVIKDANHPVFKWDGVKREFDAWNKDHTPASAFRASAVWVFQEIARQATGTRMRVYVSQFGYGNRNIKGNEDSFWLDGQLRVSALQQVEFLERFFIGKLPVHPKNAEIVKEMMFLEKIGNARCVARPGGFRRATTRSAGSRAGWSAGRTLIYLRSTRPDRGEARRGADPAREGAAHAARRAAEAKLEVRISSSRGRTGPRDSAVSRCETR